MELSLVKTTYCRQIVGFLIFALLAPPSAVFAQSTDSTTTADGTQSAAAVTVSDPVLDAPSGTMDTAAPDSEELTKTPKISNGQLKKDTTTGMDETDSSLMTMSLSGTTEPVSVEHAAQFGYDEVKATVDVQSGALTQRIPLEVPPGRNGLEPQVSLMYNSQNTENGIVGYGWSVPIPYITRVNKDGTEDLYSASTTPQFSSSIDGELIMGTTTSTQYYPRTLTEQSFEYYFEDNVWTVYDRNGTRYSFGTTTASWLYDEATTSPKIYRWMLEEVRDTSDNYIEFSYAREDGQLYPTTIMYTGHGSTDGPFTVTFTREARLDPMVSYATGFKVETKKRISQIETAVDGQWVRRYALSYTTGNNGYRSLLSSVQQTGRDASGTTESLDPFVFTYRNDNSNFLVQPAKLEGRKYAQIDTDITGNGINDSILKYQFYFNNNLYGKENLYTRQNGVLQTQSLTTLPPGAQWAYQDGSSDTRPIESGTRILDVTMDGKADIIRGVLEEKYLLENAYIYTAPTTLSWATTTVEEDTIPIFANDGTTGLLGDINGDGLPDYAVSHNSSSDKVYLGNGNGWSVSRSDVFSPVKELPSSVYTTLTDSRLVDINGDGLDDWVYTDADNNFQTYAHLNTGSGWSQAATSSYTLPFSTLYKTTAWGTTYYDRGMRFLDINGDGLVDFVRSYYSWTGHTSSDGNPVPELGEHKLVLLNTGSGWATSTAYSLNYITEYDCEGNYSTCAFSSWVFYNEYSNLNGNGQQYQDVLTNITYPLGGNTEVGYVLTTGHTANNPELPIALLTVASTTVSNNLDDSVTTTYSYEGGKLYIEGGKDDRKFAGFATVTETGPNTMTRSYFHQGDGATNNGEIEDSFYLIGKKYREDILDTASTTLYKRTWHDWDVAGYTKNAAVTLGNSLEQAHDGSLVSIKDKAVGYEYDINSATSTLSSSTYPTFWVLAVAGGGGGGAKLFGGGGGGGGAGGVIATTSISLNASSYTITIGSGGAGASTGNGSPDYGGPGSDGTYSSIGSVLTTEGGGAGGGYSTGSGASGGSGGGGSSEGSGGGSGMSGQGYDGAGGGSVNSYGGGGGGSNEGGQNQNGGDGVSSSITGTPTKYGGGGGGGGGEFCDSVEGSGGQGGGGAGESCANGISGTVNTGGGGGGVSGSNAIAGSGGSGIVIIRFSNNGTVNVLNAIGASTSTVGSDIVYTWTSSGTFEFEYTNNSPTETYATNILMATTTEYGEVAGGSNGSFTDTGSDKRVAVTTYASSTARVTVPTSVTLYDASSTVAHETKYYYDSLSFGQVQSGLRTRTEALISGSDYASTTKAHNSYGLISSETDANGNVASYAYDAKNLYPTTITNPLSQQTTYTYDYATGRTTLETDPNGRKLARTYDPLGRMKKVEQSDGASPSTLVTKTEVAYAFSTSTPSQIHETRYLSAASTTSAYTYLDGLGRTVQKRAEAEGLNTYSVFNSYYSDGRVSAEALPVHASSTAFSTGRSVANALKTYLYYDPMGRVGTTTTIVGSTIAQYGGWAATTTDPLGNPKTLLYDAFGNLVQVTENNDSSVYITQYEYDTNNNLTKITDALGNVRNLTYDKLGRRLTAEDLHASADGTFGSWSYSYDDAGNMLSYTDAKSQTVNYTYDALSRPLTENYIGAGGTEVEYAYDSCTYGVGRLCVATSTGTVSTHAYDPLGRTTAETKTIEGINYTTSYAYDRQGNQTGITYSDGSESAYTYNNAGLLESASYRDSGGSWTTVVSNFDYAPTGKVALKEFGNGTQTTYTYDADELYRLKNIQTFVVVGSEESGGGGGGMAFASSGKKYALAESAPLALYGALALADSLTEESSEETTNETQPATTTEVIEEAVDAVTPEEGEQGALATTTSTTTAFEEIPTETATSSEAELATATTTTEVASTTEQTSEDSISATTTPETVVEEPAAVATTTESTMATTTVATSTASAATTTEVASKEKKQEDTSNSVRAMLAGKSADERANIKGREIAKIKSVKRTNRTDYDIQIVSIEAIDGGVQAFVRAWGKNGVQIGFGRDGSVDIERFRIFNPPILVPDENGDIVQEFSVSAALSVMDTLATSTVRNATTTIAHDAVLVQSERRLREDMQEALLQVIEQNLGVMKSIYGPENIVAGKMGNTVSTFYPDADPEMTSVDGTVAFNNGAAGAGWATFRDATTGDNAIQDSTALFWGVLYGQPSNASMWENFLRAIFVFDTSAITDTDVVDAVTLSVRRNDNFGSFKNDHGMEIALVASAPASNTTIAAGDYDSFTYTDFATRVPFSSTANGSYVDIAMNAAGMVAVNKQGATKLGMISGHDLDNTEPSTVGVNYASRIAVDFADTSGTTQDPKLVVEHSASSGSSGAMALQDIAYAYDVAGNITTVQTILNSATTTLAYTYDDLYRLTSASTTAGAANPYFYEYTYNAIGNITTDTPNGTYLYTDSGYTNPHAATTIDGNTLAYDNNGNLTSYLSTTYTWDYKNRMTSAATTTTSTYTYDHITNRVQQWNGTATTTYPFRHISYIGLLNGTSTVATSTKYLYGPAGELLASVVSPLNATTTASATSTILYSHPDHLNSTSLITDSTASSTQTTLYYPFGATQASSGSSDLTRGYLGEYTDTATALNYLNARYMDSGRGQLTGIFL